MSSAWFVNFIGACACSTSDVYMLKIMGDRTPPCGIPRLV